MGGKAKRRRTKRVEGPVPQGLQVTTKQSQKKERTKTLDANQHRMADGEEDDDDANTVSSLSNKNPELSEDIAVTPSIEGKTSSEYRDEDPVKSLSSTANTVEITETCSLSLSAVNSNNQVTNKAEDLLPVLHSPEVKTRDLYEDSNPAEAMDQQTVTTESALEEELRQATEEEFPPSEEVHIEIACNVQNTTVAVPQDLMEKITAHKSTQTDPVHISYKEKPVKFFISDDSDSDTAIFVDASQGASNVTYEHTYGNVEDPSKINIAVYEEVEVSHESAVEVAVEGNSLKSGFENEGESHIAIDSDTEQGIDVLSADISCVTHTHEVNCDESENFNEEQTTQYLKSASKPDETGIQAIDFQENRLITLPFENYLDRDVARQSTFVDSLNEVPLTRASFNDVADQGDSKSLSNQMAENQTRQFSSVDSHDPDGSDKKSTRESLKLDTERISLGSSLDRDTNNSNASNEFVDQEILGKVSTRGLKDQDLNRRTASESSVTDMRSRASGIESVEQETQNIDFYRGYEDVEGVAEIFSGDSEDLDDTVKSSVTKSGDLYNTGRDFVCESVTESNKVSSSATGSSFSASGEYTQSKSSINSSVEFDTESVSSTADHMASKKASVGELKSEREFNGLEKCEEQSRNATGYGHDRNKVHPSSHAWEELKLEDQIQLTDDEIREEFPLRDDRSENEADAESLFFSLYPEYQPGELNELQDIASNDRTQNPDIMCFRGPTREKDEIEEVFMATEKRKISEVREERSKDHSTGEVPQFQRKHFTPKKHKRENKEIPELEGLGAQQSRDSSKEQQDTSMQRSPGAPEGGPEQSPTSTRWKPSFIVSDCPSFFTSTTDSKETEHTQCKEANDMVCSSGRLGGRDAKLAGTDDTAMKTFAVEEKMTAETPSDVDGPVTSEVDGKMESNTKGRKTLVGIAKDWIKGVTGIGVSRDDAVDRISEKSEGETKTSIETVNKKYKEIQNGSLSREDSESREEGLFDIVDPEEELSDVVFKDDICSENKKSRDSDNNEIQDNKTEDSWLVSPEDEYMFEMINPVQEKEAQLLSNAEEITHVHKAEEIGMQEITSITGKNLVSDEVINQAEFENQDNNDMLIKERESAPLVQEKEKLRNANEESESPSLHKDDKKEEKAKRSLQRDREGKGGSRKRRQRRRTKSQEDSVDDYISVQKATEKATTAFELRPEEVALPSDDFENDFTFTGNKELAVKEDVTAKEAVESVEGKTRMKDGTYMPAERKRSFRKSNREKKYSRKDSEKSEIIDNEQIRHIENQQGKSLEIGDGKHDTEILEEDNCKARVHIKSSKEEISSQDSNTQQVTCGHKPLQELTFPPGVSRPLSPLAPVKELKFPPGISKPLSPLPGLKPVPGFTCLKSNLPSDELLSPCLVFQESNAEPVSPISTNISQKNFNSFSFWNADKPLPYPARPLSPLIELKFPEGISKPASPLLQKCFVSAFSELPASSKINSLFTHDKAVEDDLSKHGSSTAEAECEASLLSSPRLNKRRLRITVPKPDLLTTKVSSPPQSAESVSPNAQNFSESSFDSQSPTTQMCQRPLFVQTTQNEINDCDDHPTQNHYDVNLPMKFPARPVSPLRFITLPEGISEPASPEPSKVFQWPLRSSSSKLPPNLDLQTCGKEISEANDAQDEKLYKKESSLYLQTSESNSGLLQELTFPEGISRPESPKKNYFSNIFIKMTHPVAKPAPTTNGLCISSNQTEDLSPLSSESMELIDEGMKPPVTPNGFAENIPSVENTQSQLSSTASLLEQNMQSHLDSDDISPVAITQNTRSKTLTLPVSSMQDSSDLELSEQKLLGLGVASTSEQYFASTTSHSNLNPEHTVPEVSKSVSPMLTNENVSSPVTIKQIENFPSETHPCTMPGSPVMKNTILSDSPIPSPRISLTSTSAPMENTVLKTSSKEITDPVVTADLQNANCAFATTTTCSSDSLHSKNESQVSELLHSTTISEDFNVVESRKSPDCFSNILEDNVRGDRSSTPEVSSAVRIENIKSTGDKFSAPEVSSVIPKETSTSTVSSTNLSYSENHQRITSSPTLSDENAQPTASTSTQHSETTQPSSKTESEREKSGKKLPTMIHTSEIRLAARFSRGESPCSRSDSPSQKNTQLAKDQNQSCSEKTDSPQEIVGVSQLREFHQSAQDALRPPSNVSRSWKEGSQSPKSSSWKEGIQSPKSGPWKEGSQSPKNSYWKEGSQSPKSGPWKEGSQSPKSGFWKEGSQSPKSGSQSSHSGCESPTKKMKRRKKR